MARYPFMVAGTGRLCTDLMKEVGDRVFVKTGAEGVYCGGLPERGWGIAVKVEDGAKRASGVALLQTLRELQVLDEADLEVLAEHARPTVTNTRGEAVGVVRAAFGLEQGA